MLLNIVVFCGVVELEMDVREVGASLIGRRSRAQVKQPTQATEGMRGRRELVEIK